MARPISRRERLLLLVALAALAALLAARPHLGRLTQIGPQAERLLEEKYRVIDAYRQAVAREGALQEQSAALAGQIADYEGSLLPGDTPALAAADLQTRLKQLADAAGLRIQSEKIMALVKRDAYLEIPVQIVTNGDIRNLKDFLVAVEASPVFIAVQEFSIRAGPVRRRPPGADARTFTESAEIQASMTLAGLIRGEK